MQRQILVLIVFMVGCKGGNTNSDPSTKACNATYAQLEDLGCEENMKTLLLRGCFEPDLAPDDCDTSVLDPCVEEIKTFAEGPGGWMDPVDTFLERKCGPEGTKAIEWPTPDRAALAAAKAAADAEVKTRAEAEAAAVEASEREKYEAVQQAAEGAHVKLTKVKIQGTLTRTQTQEVVDAELASIRECYGAGLLETPKLAGRVSINFVVTPDGDVGSSVVQFSDLHDSTVSHCMAKAIKKWSFPAPQGADNTIATISFTLTAK